MSHSFLSQKKNELSIHYLEKIHFIGLIQFYEHNYKYFSFEMFISLYICLRS